MLLIVVAVRIAVRSVVHSSIHTEYERCVILLLQGFYQHSPTRPEDASETSPRFIRSLASTPEQVQLLGIEVAQPKLI